MGLQFGGKFPSRLTVWSVTDYGKYSDVKCSASKKNKETGAYETDFSSKIRMVGNAHNKAIRLAEKDRIVIKNMDITAKWDGENNKMNVRFVCFDFDKVDADGNVVAIDTTTPIAKADDSTPDFMNVADFGVDELPFE